MIFSNGVFSVDPFDERVKLVFEPYSFTDERSGREIKGKNMFLVLPWGRVKLVPYGHKPDDVFNMILFASSDGDAASGSDLGEGEPVE